jgi:hypothetical protein
MSDQSDTSIWTEADYVSVPNGTTLIILQRRDASLLASGGEIDLERGYIKGGDRTCTLLPDGTLPLSSAELKIVRARHAALPMKDQTP